MYQGVSKPSFSLNAALASSVACCPKITYAGSPGIARIIKKTINDIPNKTGINCKSLLPI